MPTSLGAHNARIEAARELLTKKGRKAQGRFSFEGETLLHEAREAGVAIESLYVTQPAYERRPIVAEYEGSGTAVFVVDERTMQRISDLETPSGIVAVAPMRPASPAGLLSAEGTLLLLADVNDPGNAGTLLRSAEAFGAGGVIAGSLGVDPYLPKVVRSAMGALFRLPVAVAGPSDIAPLLGGWEVIGLAAGHTPIASLTWPPRSILAVGNERRGLGRWEALCTRLASIPMAQAAESLNAAVAGSIALYEATKRPAR